MNLIKNRLDQTNDDYELEFLSSPKGVVVLMEYIQSLNKSDLEIFSTLRITNMEKVINFKIFNN